MAHQGSSRAHVRYLVFLSSLAACGLFLFGSFGCWTFHYVSFNGPVGYWWGADADAVCSGSTKIRSPSWHIVASRVITCVGAFFCFLNMSAICAIRRPRSDLESAFALNKSIYRDALIMMIPGGSMLVFMKLDPKFLRASYGFNCIIAAVCVWCSIAVLCKCEANRLKAYMQNLAQERSHTVTVQGKGTSSNNNANESNLPESARDEITLSEEHRAK